MPKEVWVKNLKRAIEYSIAQVLQRNAEVKIKIAYETKILPKKIKCEVTIFESS